MSELAYPQFAPRRSVEEVEEGTVLAPKFDKAGLIPVVTTDANSGEVLMMGAMNADALSRTIATGEAHYWSRSRQSLWHKGATSGLVQKVVEVRIDDDQDAIWLRVTIRLWHKGATSGLVQKVVEVRIDDDQDAIWLRVTIDGGASCHVGYRSCFYRSVQTGSLQLTPLPLRFEEQSKVFDPHLVYGDSPNPTRL
jgi:phosphoribosyl-AMP cyclohydrolase